MLGLNSTIVNTLMPIFHFPNLVETTTILSLSLCSQRFLYNGNQGTFGKTFVQFLSWHNVPLFVFVLQSSRFAINSILQKKNCLSLSRCLLNRNLRVTKEVPSLRVFFPVHLVQFALDFVLVITIRINPESNNIYGRQSK